LDPYLALGICSALVFIGIMLLHFIRVDTFVNHDLHPTVPYIIGVSVIGSGIGLWLVLIGAPWLYGLGFIIITVATGVGDVFAYILDDARAGRRLKKYESSQRTD
jgi:hypothetical protein